MKTTVHEDLDFDVLGSDLGFTEGPVITDDGAVLVVDIDGGRVLRGKRRHPRDVDHP